MDGFKKIEKSGKNQHKIEKQKIKISCSQYKICSILYLSTVHQSLNYSYLFDFLFYKPSLKRNQNSSKIYVIFNNQL